jgi:hypothetical protein
MPKLNAIKNQFLTEIRKEFFYLLIMIDKP